jgi:protein-tyrosine phosphatase
MEARGVTAVVNLRIEFDDKTAGIAPLRYLHLPTVDDEAPTLDQLRTGVEFIAEETAREGGIYIHCASGVGRAATMAAAYLISRGMSPDQAWMAIRKVRPFVRPTAVQIEQIERFATEFWS